MNKQSITFTANEQTLEKTGGIDLYASNTVSYIEATFTLGTNWTGYDVVRAVWESRYAKISTILDSNNKCLVPTEVLKYKSKVNVNLVGSIMENEALADRLTTYPILALTVDADARVDSTETQPVTPSQFEQFVSRVEADASSIQDYSYDSEAWARGTRGGVAVPSADETYHNNSKYYADQGATLQQEVTDLKSDISPMLTTEDISMTIYNNKAIYQSGGVWGVNGYSGAKVATVLLEDGKNYHVVCTRPTEFKYGFSSSLSDSATLSDIGAMTGTKDIRGDGRYCYFGYTNDGTHSITVSEYVAKIIGDEADIAYNRANIESIASTQKLIRFSGTVSGSVVKKVDCNLPAGTYLITASSVVSSDTDQSECKINFNNGESLIDAVNLTRNAPTSARVTLNQNCDAMYLYASKDYAQSAGDTFTYNDLVALQETNLLNKVEKADRISDQSLVSGNIFRQDTFFSHLGIYKTEDIIIPCQSIADVARAKRLKFNSLELNVRKTSDNKYVCLHGSNGAFGELFTDTDGNSVADTLVNSMTLQDIKDSIRFKSKYPRYRTAPYSLQEMLYECKRQGIIPLVEYQTSYTDEIEILDKIMGANNYILSLYNENRGDKTNAVCTSWLNIASASSLTAKCKASGKQYIAMLNVTDNAYSSFTDSDWKALIDAVHSNGYLIGLMSGYAGEVLSQKLLGFGFDVSGSCWNINDFEYGNLCNLYADTNFEEFTTDGSVSNGTLSLSSGDEIVPNADIPSVFLGGGSLHIRFNGTISLVFGDNINANFTSDGSRDMWFSTFFEESVPTFTITATANTEVYDITYKASRM